MRVMIPPRPASSPQHSCSGFARTSSRMRKMISRRTRTAEVTLKRLTRTLEENEAAATPRKPFSLHVQVPDPRLPRRTDSDRSFGRNYRDGDPIGHSLPLPTGVGKIRQFVWIVKKIVVDRLTTGTVGTENRPHHVMAGLNLPDRVLAGLRLPGECEFEVEHRPILVVRSQRNPV